MKNRVLFVLAAVTLPALPLAAQAPEPMTTQIQTAYGRGDFAALAPHLADRIAFDGEVQIVADVVDGNVVMHDPTAVRREIAEEGAGGVAATISGPSLVTSYERVATRIGRDRLLAAFGNLTWRQVQSDRDGYPYREARAGDWVLYTHLRSDEGPDVLDEVVMFVLRQQGPGYRVVAHFADL